MYTPFCEEIFRAALMKKYAPEGGIKFTTMQRIVQAYKIVKEKVARSTNAFAFNRYMPICLYICAHNLGSISVESAYYGIVNRSPRELLFSRRVLPFVF
jgi:hypothetical protein